MLERMQGLQDPVQIPLSNHSTAFVETTAIFRSLNILNHQSSVTYIKPNNAHQYAH
jgi:hypothetical protein